MIAVFILFIILTQKAKCGNTNMLRHLMPTKIKTFVGLGWFAYFFAGSTFFASLCSVLCSTDLAGVSLVDSADAVLTGAGMPTAGTTAGLRLGSAGGRAKAEAANVAIAVVVTIVFRADMNFFLS